MPSENVLKPTRTSTFPMQRLQPGLKALIESLSSEEESLPIRKFRCLTRTDIFPSWSSSVVHLFRSPSSSDEMAEKASCDQEKEKETEEEEEEEEEEKEEEHMSRRQRWRNEWRRELPPPLPIVVKKEIPACQDHVSWVLKKYSYAGNGSNEEGNGKRVVIIEERVKHQEYFRVHRSNGHLTMQLICVDDDADDVSPTPSPSKNVEEEVEVEDKTWRLETESVVIEEEAERVDVDQDECCETETDEAEDVEELNENDDNNGDTNRTVERFPEIVVPPAMPELSLGSKSNGAGAKCWTISGSVGRRSNSDLFLMPIPTIRPIHG